MGPRESRPLPMMFLSRCCFNSGLTGYSVPPGWRSNQNGRRHRSARLCRDGLDMADADTRPQCTRLSISISATGQKEPFLSLIRYLLSFPPVRHPSWLPWEGWICPNLSLHLLVGKSSRVLSLTPPRLVLMAKSSTIRSGKSQGHVDVASQFII